MKVGDRVQWESQAGGCYTKKTGTIVRVVTHDDIPWQVAQKEFPNHVAMFDSFKIPKNVKEKYMVEVIIGQRRPRLYMPQVRNLKRI